MKIRLEKKLKIFIGYFLGFIFLPYLLNGMLETLPINKISSHTLVLFLTYFILSITFVFILNKDFFVELKDSFKPKNLLYVLFTVISLIFMFYFINIIYTFLKIEGTSINQIGLIEIFKNNALIFILTTVVLAPFVEEIVFRKVVLTIFKEKYNTILGIIISSFFFGFIHVSSGDYIFLPVYFILGCILGFSYSKTNNIFIVILAHGIYNLFTISLM